MPETFVRIGVLVSGGGSNLGAILKAQRQGELGAGKVVLVISSRLGAYALERAADHGVERMVLERKAYPSEEAFDEALLVALDQFHVQIVVLAGYLRKIGPKVLGRYAGRILNIHPALLPRFGGTGMYGHYVHEAVLAAGATESGCTVHVVDEEFDHGPILAQTTVSVEPGDTPETLAARILEEEHRLYPATIAEFCNRLMTTQGKPS